MTVPLSDFYVVHNKLDKQTWFTRKELGHLEADDPNGRIFTLHQLNTVQFSGDYTLTADDLGNRLQSIDATPQTLTLPMGLAVDWYFLEINQFGAGKLTIDGAINAPAGMSAVAAQYGTIGAIRETDGTWTLSGFLGT